MIRTVLFTFFLLSSIASNAQNISERIDVILNSRPRTMLKYPTPPRTNTMYLKSTFTQALFDDEKSLQLLKEKEITRVELVYTTYKKNTDFDQVSLNRKRLEKLFQVVPELSTQLGVEFILIAQTGCQSAEEGPNYFHGVTIVYRDKPNEVLTKVETEFIRAVKDKKAHSYAYDAYLKRETKTIELAIDSVSERDPVIVLPKFPGGERARIDYFTRYLNYPSESTKPSRVDVQFILDKTGKITAVNFPNSPTSNPCQEEVKDFVNNMPNWSPGTMDGKPMECVVQFSVDFMARGSIVPSPIEIFSTEAPPKKSSLPAFNYNEIKPVNSSNKVSQALGKSDFTKTVVVCDVTGSMAPYNAQVIEFIQGQFTAKKSSPGQFVFFNDGDNKKDKQKKIGETGGVYAYQTKSADSVAEFMIQVMNNGNGGGDLPENNIEAILFALKKFPGTKQIILIADNFATPRDLKLLEQLTVPVKVVVCGGAILNETYLDIAYYSKGSLFFNDSEITGFELFGEGSTIKVGTLTYVLHKGHFKPKRN